MNTHIQSKVFFWTSFIVLFIQTCTEAFASHAQSADITYKCLGGNQYQISLSFYRDCAGVNAPNTATVNISSASCGQNLTATLNPIPGTGVDVAPICTQMATQCTGGTHPGVQEYIYRGIITLPAQCTDWVFSFSLCCRNASIGTIVNPASENIYVEAHLNNLNYPCNSSPTFSNAPIPFVCIDQPYCFNNGSSDIDGDSLSYTLITPSTSASTTVTYNAPYSASQPLTSLPLVTFNTATGDMCMSPTQIQVTVFAILVKEWRNGILIGSVMRDIQLRTINCTNNNPSASGINNDGTFTTTACAGATVIFKIYSSDPDTAQNLSMVWNNGITGASFTTSTGSRPVATFSWTPTAADISTTSHCFTVTVKDDNCPYNGSQTYSYCITVTGLDLRMSSTEANCNASNGTATVDVLSGIGPFSYEWLPTGGKNAEATGLQPGTYTVNVRNASGCFSAGVVIVGTGPAPGNISINSTNISCNNGTNGTATTVVNGGQTPYTYAWSNGNSTVTINGLSAGTYSVIVTTANGCTTSESVTITQPTALAYTISHSNISCYNANDGIATVATTGGIAPYTYVWNTSPIQTAATAFNLATGMHSVIITDDNGCSISAGTVITQPTALTANAMTVNNITCNGLTNGSATVGGTGGTGPYTYTWSTNPIQYTQSVTGLAPGTYTATITDANNCTANSTITITEPSALILSAAAIPVTCNGACNGQTIVIPAGGTPVYGYQWLPGGGTSPSASGLCPGTYTIRVTDANGCVANESVVVTQPAPIITTATGSTTICKGQNTTISASSTGGNGGYIYSWSGGGTGSVQIVSPSNPTVYVVVTTDAKGCTGNTTSVTVDVTSLTAANLSVSPGSSICFGKSATVSSSVTGNTGPVVINWSNGLGSGNGPFTVSPANSTTYTVTVTDACSNTVYSTVSVVVNQLPIIDLAPLSGVGCDKTTVNFTNNSINTGAQYLWDFGDGTTSTQINPSHSYTSSGTYNINVLVTSAYGCTNTANTTCSIIIYPGTQAQFTAEAIDGTTISPKYNFINSSVNASSQLWYFGDGSSSTQKNPPLHTYPGKGEYLVKLVTITQNGCRDSISIPVEIKPEFTLYIPNAFTPDGNGTNDNFTAKGQEIIEFHMMIFNRWGELIYQTGDMSKGWDGTIKDGNELVQTGVYVYKIEVRDFTQKYHSYTGHVSLLSNEQ
ncbi:MAG: PKD domain-containing protein [Bacteroidota bacterium]